MDQTLTKSCVIFFLMDNLWVLRSWGKSLLYVYYCWRTTFLFLPSLRCSSFCWQRSPSADVSPPWNTAAHTEYVRKKIVFFFKYEYIRTKSYTHWETSAMCLCLRLTHRSSSSWRRTSFSRESPIPLVSYLGRTNTSQENKYTRINLPKIPCTCFKLFHFFIYWYMSYIFYIILVDIIFNGQQIIAHGLEGQLMKDRRDRVKGSVQDDQLRARLVRTLQTGRPNETFVNNT